MASPSVTREDFVFFGGRDRGLHPAEDRRGLTTYVTTKGCDMGSATDLPDPRLLASCSHGSKIS